MLALKSLVYAFQVHGDKMRHILHRQTPEVNKNTYPFCAAGINITCVLASILRIGDASNTTVETTFWTLFEEPSAFYEVFSIALILMDQSWHELGVTYMSFACMYTGLDCTHLNS